MVNLQTLLAQYVACGGKLDKLAFRTNIPQQQLENVFMSNAALPTDREVLIHRVMLLDLLKSDQDAAPTDALKPAEKIYSSDTGAAAEASREVQKEVIYQLEPFQPATAFRGSAGPLYMDSDISQKISPTPEHTLLPVTTVTTSEVGYIEPEPADPNQTETVQVLFTDPAPESIPLEQKIKAFFKDKKGKHNANRK